jgi:zinc transporter
MQIYRPAIIWALEFEDGKASPLPDDELQCSPGPRDFRWLHVDLTDQRSLSWIAAAESLPQPMRDLLLSPQRHQQAIVEQGYLGCVLHDIERDFDKLDAERTGTLRLVLGERLLVTARHHPVRSADIVRSRILSGSASVRGASSALNLVVSAIVDNIANVARDIAADIEVFEDILLDRPESFDHRRLIHIRRRVVQFHRLLVGMRSVFQRLEHDAELNQDLSPTIERLTQQLAAIDGDMLSIQGQLRLLREEADLKAAERTNQNLYVLSILSAMLLPPTLVTGFFGMNTGGLPLVGSPEGTLIGAMLALGSSLGVYLLLRASGFIHRS